jgi:6-pyruvoyltetrahydropterin/6-carboxytetrahydropterin synthase
MRLTREIRFALVPEAGSGPVLNSWAGWPATDTAAPILVLRATVEGEPDPITGYLCDIRRIDQIVRERGIRAALQANEAAGGRGTGDALLRAIWGAIRDETFPLARWAGMQLRLSPYLFFDLSIEDETMVCMTHEFEFSAAHRLHCHELSDAENAKVFGKCNNPTGHGHNYRVDVTITPEDPSQPVSLFDLQRIVKGEVIDRYDHKHLNSDCAEFASVNPSVENITRVVWDRLDGKIDRARLIRVRVWETPKTYAEYAGSNT